jgi:hypothetical protein
MRLWYAVLGTGAMAAAAVALGTCFFRSEGTARGGAAEAEAGQEAARLLLRETTHDFGILDPSQPCRHTFIVRNEGTAPLKIAKAGTSCQCTVSVLPKGDIPPGKGGPVEIESKIDEGQGPFRHSASFLTNDPKTPRFELTIEGRILSGIAASPASIDLAELERGRPVEAATLVFSEVWDAFTLRDVRSSIEGLSWQFSPAPCETLREHKARSGYTATFHLPAAVTSKSFSGWVEAVAEPQGQPLASRKIRLSISGHVPPIRSVYGKEVDGQGVVTIGRVAPGQTARVRLLLQVRGEHRQIRVERIEKTPAFVNVSVAPRSAGLAAKGLYEITIEVPRDAPECNYLRVDGMGEIRVLTDHPEMPEIVRLKIAFAVIDG